jgi:nitrogen fixation protein FixH
MKALKFNWGAGIAVSYLGFVALILMLVVMSMRQKIDLVTTEYYSQELKFQSKIDKKQRAQALSTPLTWKVAEQGVTLSYPAELNAGPVSGTVHFYCPSNEANDRTFKMNMEDGTQTIPTTSIPAGRYFLQMDWMQGGETYWNEGVIVIHH